MATVRMSLDGQTDDWLVGWLVGWMGRERKEETGLERDALLLVSIV